MRISRVNAIAFGALAEKTLELGPGLNVVVGPNESGKSTWHAAIYAALCGQPAPDARSPQDIRFAAYRRPRPGPDWAVGVDLDLGVVAGHDGAAGFDGAAVLDRHRRIRLDQNLLDPAASTAIEFDPDGASHGRDVAAEIRFDGCLDAARWLGFDRRSYAATSWIEQAGARSALVSVDGRNALQLAVAECVREDEAVAALDRIEAVLRGYVGGPAVGLTAGGLFTGGPAESGALARAEAVVGQRQADRDHAVRLQQRRTRALTVLAEATGAAEIAGKKLAAAIALAARAEVEQLRAQSPAAPARPTAAGAAVPVPRPSWASTTTGELAEARPGGGWADAEVHSTVVVAELALREVDRRIADLDAGVVDWWSAGSAETEDPDAAAPGSAESGRDGSGRDELGFDGRGSDEPGTAEQGHAEQGHAEQGHADQGHAGLSSAGLGHVEPGHVGLGSVEPGHPGLGSDEAGSAEPGRADSGEPDGGEPDRDDGDTGGLGGDGRGGDEFGADAPDGRVGARADLIAGPDDDGSGPGEPADAGRSAGLITVGGSRLLRLPSLDRMPGLDPVWGLDRIHGLGWIRRFDRSTLLAISAGSAAVFLAGLVLAIAVPSVLAMVVAVLAALVLLMALIQLTPSGLRRSLTPASASPRIGDSDSVPPAPAGKGATASVRRDLLRSREVALTRLSAALTARGRRARPATAEADYEEYRLACAAEAERRAADAVRREEEETLAEAQRRGHDELVARAERRAVELERAADRYDLELPYRYDPDAARQAQADTREAQSRAREALAAIDRDIAAHPSVAEAEAAIADAQRSVRRVQRLDRVLVRARQELTIAREAVLRDIAAGITPRLTDYLAEVTDRRYSAAEVTDLRERIGESLLMREPLLGSFSTSESTYMFTRVALGQHLAGDAPQGPLLVDDITSSADSVRIKRLLRILRRIAAQRQVVVFAHQSQVAKWARGRIGADPGLRLIRLRSIHDEPERETAPARPAPGRAA